MRKTFIYDVAKMTVNSSAPVKVVCQKNLLTPPKNLVGGGGRVESRNLNNQSSHIQMPSLAGGWDIEALN